MKGMTVEFRNHPDGEGGVETFSIQDCLIANNGSPNSRRPQILIHLPKSDKRAVDGAWVNYEGFSWHIVGTTIPQMDENTPTRWNRYAIAERIIML